MKPCCLAFSLLIIFVVSSCRSDTVYVADQQFLFLGHAYDWFAYDQLDPRVEHIDYEKYDQVWLGGDALSKPPEDSLYSYLTNFFSPSSTHWVRGNHEWVDELKDPVAKWTNRPDYYLERYGHLAVLVINTNYFSPYSGVQTECRERAAQITYIEDVLENLSDVAYLVVLHHHGLHLGWENGVEEDIFNTNHDPLYTTCDRHQWAAKTLYSLMRDVQERGTQVIMVGGDLGMRSKRFAYQTPEGIQLLGSGITNSLHPEFIPSYVTARAPDEVLEFTYQAEPPLLEWQFKRLNSLVPLEATADDPHPRLYRDF